jgi:predicted GNAT family N-acyltransferase
VASDIQVRAASTDDEREQIYRLRYEVYVEELGQLYAEAAHDRRLLYDPVDDVARLVMAVADGRVVGTLRVVVGADGPVPQSIYDEFHLDRLVDLVSVERMVFMSRFMVDSEYRGTDVTIKLMQALRAIWFEHRPDLSFGDCEPHLLGFYTALGWRTYCSPYHDENLDVLFPLVLVNDPDHLQRIGSPLLQLGLAELPPPANLEALRVRLPVLGPAHPLDLEGADWAAEFERLNADRPGSRSLFAGLDRAEVDVMLGRSHVLELEPGARLIRRGQVSRNLYVVLGGSLVIRDGDRAIRTCSESEVVGDVAFLLRGTRTVDADAGPEGARVLSISERSLNELIESGSRTASVILLNLARTGARRLAVAGAYDQ